MKVQLDNQVKTLDDKAIQIEGSIATVGKIATQSLMNSSSEGYLEKVDLAKKIMAADGTIDLKTEEVTLIKNAVKQMQFTAQLVYQFEQAIDPVEDDSE